MTAAGALADRFEALTRVTRLAGPHLTGDTQAVALARAAALGQRAQARLRLAGAHTVVALAGATGSGKSSLFNALARMELSPSGHLRPTTGEVHACVWGREDASALLDWLGVRHRFRRESVLDASDEATLHGLVLLDLPDMDSIATAHRVETDRLISIVDLVVWVLDPQQYADETVHDEYLAQLGALREVTVVVFNQADRLSPEDARRCHQDLIRLVAADDLAGVPVLMTSARTLGGVEELRTLLEKAVSGRPAVLARLEGDLEASLDELTPLVGPSDRTPEDGLSAGALAHLADDLAGTVGSPAATTSADPAGVRLALRHVAARASVGLPAGWPDRLQGVAAAQVVPVTVRLDAIAAAAMARRRRLSARAIVLTGWWLGVAVAVVGLAWGAWLAARGVAPPRVRGVDVPLAIGIAGAVVALLAVLIVRPLAARRKRRAVQRAERHRHEECLGVAREAVEPIRAVLRDHADARANLAAAGPGRH